MSPGTGDLGYGHLCEHEAGTRTKGVGRPKGLVALAILWSRGAVRWRGASGVGDRFGWDAA